MDSTKNYIELTSIVVDITYYSLGSCERLLWKVQDGYTNLCATVAHIAQAVCNTCTGVVLSGSYFDI